MINDMATLEKEKPNKTQEDRVLEALEAAGGAWVDGEYFLRELYLSQYHARIHGLQHKGYNIEASDFVNEHGFKSYRLKFKETLF
jgi:hypothetical protein